MRFGKGLRAGVIWGVLAGLFLLMYWQLTGRPSTPVVIAVIGTLATFLVVWGVVLTVVYRRRWRHAQADLNAGNAALFVGQLARANDLFARWSRSPMRIIAATARHNLGWALMRQGRLREAFENNRDNDATYQPQLESIAMYATSSADLALFAALLGELEEAESCTDARAAKDHNPTLPAMRAFSRAVLECRRGHHEDAARLLDEQWAVCEATLPGADLRPLRVVRAFTHAAGGPRTAGVADSLLAGLKPTYEGELDFLGAAWPEMQMFLVAHRLTRIAAKGSEMVGDPKGT